MLPRKLVPSLNMVTTSIDPPAVVSVGAPPGNLTAVEVSVPKVAVLEPVPSWVMIKVTDPPVGRLDITKPVLVASVTLWTYANEQSTVIVELDVNVSMSSL